MTATQWDYAVDLERLPRHIAIIMDGNGRWAERRGVSRVEGHEAGAASVRAVVECCRELGIEALTLFAFSTENWRRSQTEINALFRLLSKYVRLELDNLHAQRIRVAIMGRMQGLPKAVIADLNHCMEATSRNSAMTLNLAVNYGARAELADAAQAIARDAQAGRLDIDSIDEACLNRYLYCPELPDLDLLIRTSGEMRISNFMLWQAAYAEIVVTDTLWPDFRKEHALKAIAEFQTRERRFGGRV